MEQYKNYNIVVASSCDQVALAQASELINQYADQGFMLPQTAISLAAMADKQHLALAVTETDVIGTAAVTVEYLDGSSEFGAWAVKEGWRGHKVGKAVFEGLILSLAKLPEPLIAFGNPLSGTIFEQHGAQPLDQSLVHPDAFRLCQGCKCHGKLDLPVGRKCVDTIYDLTPLALGVINKNI